MKREQPPEERLASLGQPSSSSAPSVKAESRTQQRGPSCARRRSPRQGGARRRRDRPRRSVNEQLERQRAADHRVAPRAGIRTLPCPAAPVRARCLQAPLDVLRASETRAAPGGPRTARSAPSSPRAPRSARRSPPRRCAPRPRPRNRPPARRARRWRPASLHGSPAVASSPVAEGGGDPPSHRDPPMEAVHSPDQLARRAQLGVRQGHHVGDTDHAHRVVNVVSRTFVSGR